MRFREPVEAPPSSAERGEQREDRRGQERREGRGEERREGRI
jgi:hypothetical protein